MDRPLSVVISNSAETPIYEQIKEQIRGQIVTGILQEGDMLPSIRKLAAELQVSVITTKRAYDDLEQEGLIDMVNGKGCFVASHNKNLIMEKRMHLIEGHLLKAVRLAGEFGIEKETLMRMLDLLSEEDL